MPRGCRRLPRADSWPEQFTPSAARGLEYKSLKSIRLFSDGHEVRSWVERIRHLSRLDRRIATDVYVIARPKP
jgi:hypothetical protein